MEVKIAICDDERAELDYLSIAARKWARENGIQVTVSAFLDAVEFLADQKNIDSDILLLDIQMPGMSGVELAGKIRGEYKNETVQIIFVTGFSDYISFGYEVEALHYLMKPVKEDKLFEVLSRALKKLGKIEKTIILASVDGGNVPIKISDIMYVESFEHCSELNVAQKDKKAKIAVRVPINEIERSLGEISGDFIKCHRSYIVGLKHVKKITKTDIVLDDGSAVPVSRRLYNEVNQAMIKFFKEER